MIPEEAKPSEGQPFARDRLAQERAPSGNKSHPPLIFSGAPRILR